MNKGLKIQLSKQKHHLLKYKVINSKITKFYNKNYEKELKQLLSTINDCNNVDIDSDIPINDILIGLVEINKNNIRLSPKRENYYKYKKFLDHNSLRYETFNIHASNWLEKVYNYDIIIWGMDSDPASLYEEKTKIYFLEKYLNKFCYPSTEELWAYEDKIRQYYILKHNNMPVVPTFITFDKNEAMQYIENTEFPKVAKLNTSSGSTGVTLVKSKTKAKKFINKVFADGRKTPYTYTKQKNYILFQDFINDADYDLRVIIIGDKVFGYYRLKPKNDFRASGAGIYLRKELPIDAIKIALKVKKIFNARMIAVDMINSKKTNQHYIIEASIFFGVDTPEQLKINNIPGYYKINNDGNILDFSPGKYWVQELTLNEVLKEYKNKNNFNIKI